MATNEEWRDVKGFEGLYQVSSAGRVKSLYRSVNHGNYQKIMPETIMKTTRRSGYPTLILRKDGARYSRQVHRLVAEAFVPNPNNLPVVNHIDRSRENNSADNLEWCTQQHNVVWSAENMRKPHRVCKPTNTGEKYISYTKMHRYMRYVVCIWGHGKIPSRSFKTLEQAVAYRNEVLNGNK